MVEASKVGKAMTRRRIWRLAAAGLAATAAVGCKSVEHAVHPGGCHDASLTLYFDENSDQLTEEGRQIVQITSRRMKACPVQELRLVGLADPAGSPQANVELSQRRANTVLDAFVHAGTPVP